MGEAQRGSEWKTGEMGEAQRGSEWKTGEMGEAQRGSEWKTGEMGEAQRGSPLPPTDGLNRQTAKTSGQTFQSLLLTLFRRLPNIRAKLRAFEVNGRNARIRFGVRGSKIRALPDHA